MDDLSRRESPRFEPGATSSAAAPLSAKPLPSKTRSWPRLIALLTTLSLPVGFVAYLTVQGIWQAKDQLRLALKKAEEAKAAQVPTRSFAESLSSERNPVSDLPSIADIFRDLNLTELQASPQPLEDALAERLVRSSQSLTAKEKGSDLNAAQSLLQHVEALLALGHAEKAMPLAERAYQSLQEQVGDADPITIASLSLRGLATQSSGQAKSSLPLHLKAFELSQSHLGKQAPLTLDCGQRLARCYVALGAWEKVPPILEECVSIRREVEGEQSLPTLYSMGELADAFALVGDYESAIVLNQECVGLLQASVGTNHPATLDRMLRSAEPLMESGYYADAISLLDETVELRRKLLGPNHLATLECNASLANAICQSGNRAKGDSAFERLVRQINESKDGNPKLRTKVLFHIASQLIASNRADLAIGMVTELHSQLNTALGSEHLSTARSLALLATCQYQLRKLDQALSNAQRSLEIMASHFDGSHPECLAIRDTLAQCYLEMQRFQSGMDLARDTMQRSLQTLGETHPGTLNRMLLVADAEARNPPPANPIPHYLETLERIQKRFGEDHPTTVRCMYNLASHYRALGRTADALPLFQSAFDKLRERYGDRFPQAITALYSLGLTKEDAKQWNEAIACYERVWEIRNVEQGLDHPDSINTLRSLLHAYRLTRNYDKGLEIAETLVTAMNLKHGPDTLESTEARLQVAWLHGIEHDFDQAITIQEDCCSQLQRLLGPNHERTLLATAQLAFFLRDAGRVADAIPRLEKVVEASHLHPSLQKMHIELRHLYRLNQQLEPFHALVVRELESIRSELPPNDPKLASELIERGRDYLELHAPQYAEPLLREGLGIYQAMPQPGWILFLARSLLGESLIASEQWAESQRLLEEGYEGLKQYREQIPEALRERSLVDAIQRRIALAEAMHREDEAQRWKEELAGISTGKP